MINKKNINNFVSGISFYISNTATFIPYILFLSLANSTKWCSFIPAILYYTLKMTGVLLLKGVRSNLNNHMLLNISFLFGIAGSLFGILGFFYFPLYAVSGILLGLTASWIRPLNVHVTYLNREKGLKPITAQTYIVTILLLMVVSYSLSIKGNVHVLITMIIYFVLYIISYCTTLRFFNCQQNKQENTRTFKVTQDAYLFLLYFLLLIVMQAGRLLFNAQMLIIGTILFSILFCFFIIFKSFNGPKLPKKIHTLSFLIGMLTNFLVLFCLIFLSGTHGYQSIIIQLYVPYVMAIILANIYAKKILKAIPTEKVYSYLLVGIILSFLLFIPDFLTSLSIFGLSFMRSLSGIWLNQVYYSFDIIQEKQRIVSKYVIQNKGNITQQILLIASIFLITHLSGEYVINLLNVHYVSHEKYTMLMELKYSQIIFFVCLVSIMYVIEKWHNRTKK